MRMYGQTGAMNNPQNNKVDDDQRRLMRPREMPEATRRAFLAVIAAIKRDHPADFPKLLKEAIDTHA